MTKNRPISQSRLIAAAAALWFILSGAATLSAHPTATSFVIITTGASTAAGPAIDVAITTEAESLLMKLEALGGGVPPVRRLTSAAVDGRLNDLEAVLREHVDLRVDDAPVTLAVASIMRVKDRPEQVSITLRGSVPASATGLRWRSSLFFGSYPLAVRTSSTTAATIAAEEYEWLSGAELSRAYALAAVTTSGSGWAHTGRLIAVGFAHIIPGGLDHVLFVLGLFLLASNTRTLLLQISAFTLAHSCTLALALAGWVSAPGRVVEPLIAVSIAYVAVENLMTTSLSRWRLGVVFVFGLLHGLGFASALAELGLSHAHFASTLIGFNVGVELGQIAVVAAAALVVRMLSLTPHAYRRTLARPASAAIAAIGVCWAVQRVFF